MSFSIDRIRDRSQVTETYTTAVAAVSGKVTAEDGTALKGATVKLGSNTAKTDDAGNYSFDAIETGTYNLSFRS